MNNQNYKLSLSHLTDGLRGGVRSALWSYSGEIIFNRVIYPLQEIFNRVMYSLEERFPKAFARDPSIEIYSQAGSYGNIILTGLVILSLLAFIIFVLAYGSYMDAWQFNTFGWCLKQFIYNKPCVDPSRMPEILYAWFYLLGFNVDVSQATVEYFSPNRFSTAVQHTAYSLEENRIASSAHLLNVYLTIGLIYWLMLWILYWLQRRWVDRVNLKVKHQWVWLTIFTLAIWTAVGSIPLNRLPDRFTNIDLSTIFSLMFAYLAVKQLFFSPAINRWTLRMQGIFAVRETLTPHTLFHLMSPLQNLIDKDPARAKKYASNISTFSEQLINATKFGGNSKEYVGLWDEMEDTAGAYLHMMQVAWPRQFVYRVECEDFLRGAQVPPLILLPLVENAIEYGIKGTGVKQATISVVAKVEGENALIEVTNVATDWREMSLKQTAGWGIGLSIVRDKMGWMWRNAKFEHGPIPNGYNAKITIPIRRLTYSNNHINVRPEKFG